MTLQAQLNPHLFAQPTTILQLDMQLNELLLPALVALCAVRCSPA